MAKAAIKYSPRSSTMRIVFWLTCLFIPVAVAVAVLVVASGERTAVFAAPLPAGDESLGDRRPDETKEQVQVKADNSACLACHSD